MLLRAMCQRRLFETRAASGGARALLPSNARTFLRNGSPQIANVGGGTVGAQTTSNNQSEPSR
eukprot:8417283-Lingulodinium_polyedra.AAC.1